MAKVNKYLYGWKFYCHYGQGWEYECFELSVITCISMNSI